MPEYEKFSAACQHQDTSALVDYAVSLKNRGCTIDLGDGRGRRLNSGDDGLGGPTLAPLPAVPETRRLQAAGACAGFADDPDGVLAAHGVTCEMVVNLGCGSDLSVSQRELPEGSLVSMLCPVSCNECQ